MPILPSRDCYKKWILDPQELLRLEDRSAKAVQAGKPPIPPKPTVQTAIQMQELGTITPTLRAHVKGAEQSIQEVLSAADTADQFERDVAMWYGYCKDHNSSKGAELCLRLFSALLVAGVLYKKSGPNGAWSWGNFGNDFPNVPVASLLSHGGRILFLLPMSNSLARTVASTIGAAVKGVTVDPLKATFGRGMHQTLRPESKAGTAFINAGLRAGFGAVGSILSTGHKMWAAGDDRFFDWLTDGDLHSRALATHSTKWCGGFDKAQPLGYNRKLWFTEEKAQGGSHHLSNLRDGMMGRHFYKNVALGGVGNINPFSGVTIDKEGGHGHLYVNYRAPTYQHFGCLLAGVEGSAPGFSDQTGKVHDARAIKGLFSPTGGKKWASLFVQKRIYDPEDKNDMTQFVCDLSDLPTSQAIQQIRLGMLQPDELHNPVNPVKMANWSQVLEHMRG
jgi:hypothetical protein